VSKLRKLWSISLDILFPEICFNCKHYLDEVERGVALCQPCYDSIEVSKVEPHPKLIVLGSYQNAALRVLLNELRYNSNPGHALSQLNNLIIKFVQSEFGEILEKYHLVTYLPTHVSNELIAKVLSESVGLESRGLFSKTNRSGSYTIKNSESIRGKKVILVVDIYTPNVGVEKARKILERSDVADIKLFTIAINLRTSPKSKPVFN